MKWLLRPSGSSAAFAAVTRSSLCGTSIRITCRCFGGMFGMISARERRSVQIFIRYFNSVSAHAVRPELTQPCSPLWAPV